LLLCNGCVEEIEFNESSFDRLLIVTANITDEYKTQQVTLSRTNSLNSNETLFESNASVTIVDSSLKTYAFTEKPDGLYESNLPFKAELGQQYTLHIKTSDGEMYESNPEEIQGVNDIDEIVAKADTDFYGEEGISITVKSESSDKSAKYYKYTYSETYKIVAPYFNIESLRIISDIYPWKVEKYFHTENRKICYNTIKSIGIIQTETNSLSENAAILPLRFIKKNDSIIAHRYSIEVQQHVQSYEAYTYFKTVTKLSNSENVFSQSQQGFLQGNIMPTIHKKNQVIGFFEVSSASKKRIFFNLTDVLPDHFVDTSEPCTVYAPRLFEFDQDGIPFTDHSALINALKDGYLYTDRGTPVNTIPGPFKLVEKKCGDCRVYGSNIKPDFWID